MKTTVIKFEMVLGYEVLTIMEHPSIFKKLLFRAATKQKQFINSGRQYMVDGLWMWNNFPDMTPYGRYEELDLYIRKRKFGFI